MSQLAFPLARPSIDENGMSSDEIRVVRALEWGSEQAKQIEELAEECAMPGRKVQQIVRRLREEHAVPIGSSMGRPFGNSWTIRRSWRSAMRCSVRIVPRDGVNPNVRPECLKKLLSDVEILYPPKPPATPAVPVGRVVDPDAAEGAADEADLPMPAAVAEGGE